MSVDVSPPTISHDDLIRQNQEYFASLQNSFENWRVEGGIEQEDNICREDIEAQQELLSAVTNKSRLVLPPIANRTDDGCVLSSIPEQLSPTSDQADTDILLSTSRKQVSQTFSGEGSDDIGGDILRKKKSSSKIPKSLLRMPSSIIEAELQHGLNEEVSMMKSDELMAHAESLLQKAVRLSGGFSMRALMAVDGRKELNIEEGLRLFTMLDENGDGYLTKDEITETCTQLNNNKSNQDVLDLLEKYDDTPFGLLKNRATIAEVFKAANLTGSGYINKIEWKLFLSKLIERDYHYMLERGFASDIKYWARGGFITTPEPEYFFLNREWWKDLYFYECNNNGLLGLFFADEHSRLNVFERLNIEFCCQGWTLFWCAVVSTGPPGGNGTMNETG